MDPLIKAITLKNFRSIPWARVELDNPIFLVGKNGAGKSNFADAFAFLSEAMTQPLQTVFDNRPGVRHRVSDGHRPRILGLKVEFGPLNGEIAGGYYAFEVKGVQDYGIEVAREQCAVDSRDSSRRFWFDREGSEFNTNIEGIKPAPEPTALALPIVGGHNVLAPIVKMLSLIRTYSIEPAKLREMQDPDGGTALRRDGSNAASVLQEIRRREPKMMERIFELLATIVPHTTKVRPVKHGNKLAIEFTQEISKNKIITFESYNISDGTLRTLGLLAAIFQQPIPTLLVIEEPEATIHPGAIGALLDLLQMASRKMQVVVTTHSPDILDAQWLQDTQLRVVEWEAGASRIASLSGETRAALQEHLMGAGELLRHNALTPVPLCKPPASILQTELDELFSSLR